jgi:DUF971 family protein
MSNRPNTIPKRIDLNKREGFLEIEWPDGEVCRYPLSQLREACPCAECRGGHEYMGDQFAPDNILKLTPARSYNVVRLDLSGNYALQPLWDDGHQSGIYTWGYLRKICPPKSDNDE